MFDDITPFLKILFSKEAPSGRMVEFEWWLIRRKGRPFLLLPTTSVESHVALELYSAQRRRAKIMRALLPLLLKTPAAFLLPRVRIQVDTASELIQFMARQSGVPVERLRAPAIKVGGIAAHKVRFVMMLCDAANRPVKVAKVGLNPRGWVGLHPDGWDATEQEAGQLELLPSNLVGCIQMTGRISTPALTAFATTYFSGDSPSDDEGMEHLFHAWLNPQAPVPVESFHSWRELETAFSRSDPLMWQVLNRAVAGKKVHSTIQHGDFAPWNIRATSQQNLQVFDWERGQMQGMPGWDWFHFFVQTAILARRYNEKRVAAEVEHLFQSPRFQIYAAAARIKDITKPLFLAYLLHQKLVVKPVEGRETTERLYQMLSARWGLKPFAPAGEPVVEKALPGRDQGLAAAFLSQMNFTLSQLLNLIWGANADAGSQTIHACAIFCPLETDHGEPADFWRVAGRAIFVEPACCPAYKLDSVLSGSVLVADIQTGSPLGRPAGHGGGAPATAAAAFSKSRFYAAGSDVVEHGHALHPVSNRGCAG